MVVVRPGAELAILKKAARLDLIRKEVELNDGTVFEFWHKPLVLAEREAANKTVSDNDGFGFLLQLFINKACRQNGQRMFSQGQIAEFKNEVRDSDLQKLMAAVMDENDAEGNGTGITDMKSTQEGSEESTGWPIKVFCTGLCRGSSRCWPAGSVMAGTLVISGCSEHEPR